jgi:uncharacterized protein
MKQLLFLPTLLLSFLFANPAFSADLNKGADAYAKGDYATALREWKPLAEQGNFRAQHNLGTIYDFGRGVPKNYKTAFKWYELAAKQGYADSQFNLATFYDRGLGVLQDYVRAHMWYNIAATEGDAGARKNRDSIAKQMTPTQIETTQQLARECVEKNYKGC